MPIRSFIFWTCLVWVQTPFALGQPDWREAVELLRTGQSELAYTRLLALQGDYAGLAQYDLLLAESALATGRANIALYALERVITLQPHHVRGQLLLGQAYLELGQHEQARRQLASLLQEPGLAGAERERALQLWQQLPPAPAAQGIRAYLAVASGHDSNVNAATSSLSFLGYDLSANSMATASDYLHLSAGGQWQAQFEQGNLYGGLDWRGSQFPQAAFVDSQTLGVQLGWQRPRRYLLAYQASQMEVSGAVNNRGSHLFFMYQPVVTPQLNYYLRYGDLTYAPVLKVQNVQQTLLGLQWSGDPRRTVTASVLLGRDLALEPGSPYGRDYSGLQFERNRQIMNRVTLAFGGSVLYSTYQGVFFGQQRQDHQVGVHLGVTAVTTRGWEVGIDSSYTRAASTILLYDYDRLTIGLNVKLTYAR